MSARRFLLWITLVPVPLAWAFAQKAAAPTETQPLIVSVLDRTGTPIRDLAKEDFVARVNGKTVEVLEARYSLAPRRIVVLLDVSASMSAPMDPSSDRTNSEGSFKCHVAREALDAVLTQTPQEVAIAVLTFDSRIRDRFDFSEDRAAVIKWSALGPGQQPAVRGKEGYTALYDAVSEGLKLLGQPQEGDSIYAITDGGDNASKTLASQLKQALLQSRVRLFALFPPDLMPTHEEAQGVDSLAELASDSGGSTFGDPYKLRSPYADGYRERIKAYTRDLNLRVGEFWVLKLPVPPPGKPSKLKLELAGNGRKTRNGVQLTYPRLLPGER